VSDEPCEDVLREIEDLVERGTDPLSVQAIAVHLETCYPCDRVEFERRLRIILSAKCSRDPVPARLLSRVRSMLEETPPDRPRTV
jgi:anti-sigma factor (TIGR02949 family)